MLAYVPPAQERSIIKQTPATELPLSFSSPAPAKQLAAVSSAQKKTEVCKKTTSPSKQSSENPPAASRAALRGTH